MLHVIVHIKATNSVLCCDALEETKDLDSATRGQLEKHKGLSLLVDEKKQRNGER